LSHGLIHRSKLSNQKFAMPNSSSLSSLLVLLRQTLQIKLKVMLSCQSMWLRICLCLRSMSLSSDYPSITTLDKKSLSISTLQSIMMKCSTLTQMALRCKGDSWTTDPLGTCPFTKVVLMSLPITTLLILLLLWLMNQPTCRWLSWTTVPKVVQSSKMAVLSSCKIADWTLMMAVVSVRLLTKLPALVSVSLFLLLTMYSISTDLPRSLFKDKCSRLLMTPFNNSTLSTCLMRSLLLIEHQAVLLTQISSLRLVSPTKWSLSSSQWIRTRSWCVLRISLTFSTPTVQLRTPLFS